MESVEWDQDSLWTHVSNQLTEERPHTLVLRGSYSCHTGSDRYPARALGDGEQVVFGAGMVSDVPKVFDPLSADNGSQSKGRNLEQEVGDDRRMPRSGSRELESSHGVDRRNCLVV